MECRQSVVNFASDCTKLPLSVLLQLQKDLLDYRGLGISVLELHHRSPEFAVVLDDTRAGLRELLKIPENYKILFLQCSASGQFSAIPFNFIGLKEARRADFVITGPWSAEAAKEARKLGEVRVVHPEQTDYTIFPDPSKWHLSPDASYLYYCDNDSISGVEFHFIPDSKETVLISDMSSNFLSKPLDVCRFGVIFAAAQMNLGCAGVTVVLVREDLLESSLSRCPTVLDYKLHADGIISSPPCYRCPVDPKCRSRMNILFRVGGPDGSDCLEQTFVNKAAERGMISLKSHRSVGGICASLFNVTLEETQKLAEFMISFKKEHI
ncbi:phosphoserine aminotransferase-like isoform X3 [Leucoraja erinacea]|uniref:phosphoserine aminotransferase-like isoform X3 n=1 Tax=Leucoraja erinaceus TaxID=7782 RepID=UPI002458A8E4|nr:phosphoserine aminotransferase-like isoform X3 [Leucoraja erinacea]